MTANVPDRVRLTHEAELDERLTALEQEVRKLTRDRQPPAPLDPRQLTLLKWTSVDATLPPPGHTVLLATEVVKGSPMRIDIGSRLFAGKQWRVPGLGVIQADYWAELPKLFKVE